MSRLCERTIAELQSWIGTLGWSDGVVALGFGPFGGPMTTFGLGRTWRVVLSM